MKLTTAILHSSFIILHFSLSAAVPLRWQVETSRVQPVAFDAVRGETLALEAAFNSYGTPLELPSGAALFYQTNGMGSAWWQIPATVASNRIAAVFAPTNDPGASVVQGFLGVTGDIYRAIFTLRFRRGPGAIPNAITQPVPTLDLANTVVINPPWPSTNDFISATNIMEATLKTYVDEQIAGAGTVSPSLVTNISGRVTSNVVSKAYVENLGITAGLTTNDVRAIVDDKRDMTNLVVQMQTSEIWRWGTYGLDAVTPEMMEFFSIMDTYYASKPYYQVGWHLDAYWTYEFTEIGGCGKSERNIPFQVTNIFSGASFRVVASRSSSSVSRMEDAYEIVTRGLSSPTMLDICKAYTDTVTNGLSSTYYPKASGDAWSTYWDGDDVRVTITNYDSAANIPSLYLEQRTNETALATNLFKTVWREMAHWERFLGTNWNWRATWGGFASWSESIENELTNKADRAWGYYDSHTGSYAPDGYTVISSSNIMIAANMTYQKTVTSSAEVWVLTANEPYEPTGISTNGGFQIRDIDGNVQFEIVKGDKVTAAAQANAVTVDQTTTPNTLVVTYNIVANQHPTAEVCLDLATANWKAETAADCPATVTWSGSSGAYVARIQPTASTAKCFVKASYERGGDTYIRNRCAVSMSQIILNGTTYNLGTATISGNTVLTLTPAN